MKRMSFRLAAAAAVAVVAAAGCGGSEPESAPRDGTEMSIGSAFLATTDPDLNQVDLEDSEREGGIVAGVPALRAEDDVTPPPAAVATARAACAGTTLAPSGANVGDVANATLCLLNAERAARSLRPLRANRLLALAARRHAQAMVAQRFFSHDTPQGVDFVTRIKRAGYMRGYRGWSVGENLAWGASTLAQPREIVEAWMASRGHRANILNRTFREIGIGIILGVPAAGGAAGATYVTEFGTLFR